MEEPRHEIYGSIDRVQSAHVRVVHAYWTSVCLGRKFPPVAAIDPFALRAFLFRLVIVDMTNIERPRYRLVGTAYREVYNHDLTGSYVADAWFPEAAWLAAKMTEIAKLEKPCLGWLAWHSDRGTMYQVEFALLPFGDAGRVERLLGTDDLSQVMADK